VAHRKEPVRSADVKALMREIQRYLAFVEALRRSNDPLRNRGGGGSTR
jgi:hypothetical protein